MYSPSTNEDSFPLFVIDFVSLEGASEDGVILDAEGVAGVLKYVNVNHSNIHNLKNVRILPVQNGGIHSALPMTVLPGKMIFF